MRGKWRSQSPALDLRNWLDAGRFRALPAIPEWSDFDDRHATNCIFLQSTISVHANMIEPKNGHALPTQDKRLLPKGDQRRYTAETVLRTRPKTYRKIVHLLADPNWSAIQISKACRVSEHTVRAIREREAKTIAERKKTLVALLANVAERGAERMEETIGKASFRETAIGTGIAVDKMLALTGQSPCVQVAVVMPTPEEEAERERTDAMLDAITKRLA
jgi:hypothetical protein